MTEAFFKLSACAVLELQAQLPLEHELFFFCEQACHQPVSPLSCARLATSAYSTAYSTSILISKTSSSFVAA